MGQKKEEKIVDKFGNVEKVNKKELKEEKEHLIQREKFIQKKIKKNKGKLLDVKEIPTYKMLYKNFLKRYEEALLTLNNNNNEYLTEEELYNLLHSIGMISHPNNNKENKNEDQNEEKNNNNEEEEIPLENPIQQDETKLINLLITNLKNDQNQINKYMYSRFTKILFLLYL